MYDDAAQKEDGRDEDAALRKMSRRIGAVVVNQTFQLLD
jgi:hypothetical protein